MLTAAPSEQRAASRAKLFRGAVLCSLFAVNCSLPYAFADGPADPHFQAGLAYERLGRYDESYTELQLAFALDQDNAGIALALGIVASRLGRAEVAQRALERSIALDSDSVASYYQLALVYEKRGGETAPRTPGAGFCPERGRIAESGRAEAHPIS